MAHWLRVVFVIVLMIPGLSEAVDLNYSLFSGVGYSDSLTQTFNNADGDESGRITSAGIDFALSTDQNLTVSSNISGRYEKNKYSIDDLSDDNEKSLEASFLVQPASSNFSLAVLESLQQVALDRESTLSVNNIRDVNTFSAAPSYYINLSSLSRLNFEYRYTKLDDKEFDDSRRQDTYNIGLERQINTIASWSLNAQSVNVEYLDFEYQYDQEEIYLAARYNGPSTQTAFEIGRQRIVEIVGSPEDAYQNSIRLAASRRINSSSNLAFSFRQGYADTININLNAALIGIAANDQSGFISGIVKEQASDLDYTYSKRSTDISLRLGMRRVKSDDEIENNSQNTDEKRDSASFSYRYRFGSLSNQGANYSILIGYNYEENNFYLTGLENKVGTARARLSYSYSPQVEAFLEFSSRDASGNDPANNFDEQRVFLGFTIRPRGRRF